MSEDPQLAFPPTWRTLSLGELAKVKGGKRLPAGSEFAVGETPFPYIRVTDMVDGTVDEKDLAYVTPQVERVIRNYKISAIDLYVTIAGTLGNFGRIPAHLDNSQLTENAAKITQIDTSLVSRDYLYRFLTSDFVRQQVDKHIGRGGGVPKLALHRIETIQVAFPHEPAEQNAIVQVFDLVDEVIHHTKTLISKYQSIKHGMMHDLFTRGVDENCELRPSYEETPELYKMTELGWVPKQWNVLPLGSLVPSHRPIVYGILMPGYGHPGGVPVIKVRDIKNSAIDLSDLLLTSPDIDAIYARSRCRPGDLLFSIRGTVGRIAFVPDELEFCNITQDTARISIEKAQPRYVRYALEVPATRKFVQVNTLGVAVQGINLRDVRMIPILCPESDEQIRIAARLDAIADLITRSRSVEEKLLLLKQGLMHDILFGKVQVPSTQPNQRAA